MNVSIDPRKVVELFELRDKIAEQIAEFELRWNSTIEVEIRRDADADLAPLSQMRLRVSVGEDRLGLLWFGTSYRSLTVET
jgi:hypothetical protein